MPLSLDLAHSPAFPLLHFRRDRLVVAPKAEDPMSRIAGPSSGVVTVGGGMAGRLARLNTLVSSGVLTPDHVSR